jgi:hypothetical protein
MGDVPGDLAFFLGGFGKRFQVRPCRERQEGKNQSKGKASQPLHEFLPDR